MSGRIEARFAALRAAERGGFVAFVTADDPDHETSKRLILGLPGAGADLIELGMPFTDPMADGPAVQASSQRALRAGASMRRTLDIVREFRGQDRETPIILMGYYNPIYSYGVDAFLRDAREAQAPAPPRQRTLGARRPVLRLQVLRGLGSSRLRSGVSRSFR